MQSASPFDIDYANVAVGTFIFCLTYCTSCPWTLCAYKCLQFWMRVAIFYSMHHTQFGARKTQIVLSSYVCNMFDQHNAKELYSYLTRIFVIFFLWATIMDSAASNTWVCCVVSHTTYFYENDLWFVSRIVVRSFLCVLLRFFAFFNSYTFWVCTQHRQIDMPKVEHKTAITFFVEHTAQHSLCVCFHWINWRKSCTQHYIL